MGILVISANFTVSESSANQDLKGRRPLSIQILDVPLHIPVLLCHNWWVVRLPTEKVLLRKVGILLSLLRQDSWLGHY